MEDTLQVLQGASPGTAGLHFIWAISFGQLLTIGIALLGAFAAVVQMRGAINALKDGQEATDKRVANHAEDTQRQVMDLTRAVNERVTTVSNHVSRMEMETMQDMRELRRSIEALNQTLLALRIASSPALTKRARRPKSVAKETE